MDELAQSVKMDPLEFRLKNAKDERLRNVIVAAADKFGWKARQKTAGRGFGIAAGFEKGGYVATCAEVSVEPKTGAVKVLRAVVAFECGAVVNPEHLRNQVEGAIAMGLGGALFEEIQFGEGKIATNRLAKYRVPRFADMPVIESVLLDRKDLVSAGAGETPIVGIAPAIGNAIFDASGNADSEIAADGVVGHYRGDATFCVIDHFVDDVISSAFAAAPALMPLPVTVRPATGKLTLDSTFRADLVSAPDVRLDAAIGRFVVRLSRQTGIPMPGLKGAAPKLRVDCASAGNDYPTLGEDESYTLDVTSEGALLKAPTRAGALHGLETFGQLVTLTQDGFEVAAVHIEDHPRFPWRGLMLDSARHWMPLEVVKRNLDAMAAVKLNVFHWHLSDDQGFRVESKRFPKLQQEGSDGLFYTQDEIRGVVAYARDRGIRVVPEFDIPGHTTAWLVGYPELGTNPGPYEIGRKWGVYENALDPSREETYAFLDAFFEEMTALFPDPYFHIGGDEVVAKQWNASARVQALAKEHNLKDAHAIQAYFNQRVQKLLQKRGKILIGWDEVLHPDLPQDIVVQSWRGQKSLAEAANKGYRGILSWGYYLDHLSPAAFHYGVDPMSGDADSLGPEQKSRILGGEMCMWAEYTTAEMVDSRIWPRAAAIAERLWSPAATRTWTRCTRAWRR